MGLRDVRTMLLTAMVAVVLASAWIIYVAVRPPEPMSGGGSRMVDTASTSAVESANQ